MGKTMSAAVAVAMMLGAPASTQGYDPKAGSLESQIAAQCSGKKGAQRATCTQRITTSYERHLARAAPAVPSPRKR